MTNTNTDLEVPILLGSTILTRKAQITMAEIGSLPFVGNPEDAATVMQSLMRRFRPCYPIEVSSSNTGRIGRPDIKLTLKIDRRKEIKDGTKKRVAQ